MRKILIGLTAGIILSGALFGGIKVYSNKKQQEHCYKTDMSTFAMASKEAMRISENIDKTGDFTDAHLVYEYNDLVQKTYKHIMTEHMSVSEQKSESSRYKTLYVVAWTVGQYSYQLERMEANAKNKR